MGTPIAHHTAHDPFSAEGELLNLHNFFHQGQFQEAIDFDTAGLSEENKLPARIISLRAQIALGRAEDVIADVQGEQEVELVAVGALADLKAGNESKAVKTAEKLASEAGDNSTVQVLAGIVLQAAGKSEEALALLSQHQGNLEAVALIVQIHLEQNRTDWLSKKSQQLGNGLKIVCLSTLQSHGLACEWAERNINKLFMSSRNSHKPHRHLRTKV